MASRRRSRSTRAAPTRRRSKANNAEHETGIEIRRIKYLNNIVEQDHRAVKRATRPMLGFKSFRSAVATLSGIELMHMIRKGQSQAIERYEHELLIYATEKLRRIPGLTFIGTAAEKASVLSFVLNAYRVEDVGKALDRDGVAVRAGHHCAQPILRQFGLEATVRPSLAFYNTRADVDALVASLLRLQASRPDLAAG